MFSALSGQYSRGRLSTPDAVATEAGAYFPVSRLCTRLPTRESCSDMLLTNQDDGIEIAYNSAGVLSNLTSDGSEKVRCSRMKML